jgi:hypothetical protein
MGTVGMYYIHCIIAFTIPQGNGLDAFTVMHKITGGGGDCASKVSLILMGSGQ